MPGFMIGILAASSLRRRRRRASGKLRACDHCICNDHRIIPLPACARTGYADDEH